MAKLSVIMSTYNTDEELLRKSINSVLQQSYSDFEFIIVNDGSTKNDLEIINRFEDNRIKIIDNPVNQGLPTCLNLAINKSTGKYIVRMDSDDICKQDRFARQVKYMEENKNIDVLGTFARYIGDSRKLALTPLTKAEYTHIILFIGNTLLHPTVMMRKNFLDTNQLRYNENFQYAQDFELWTRCAEKGTIEILPEVLLYLRKHQKQVSFQKSNSQKNYAKKILKGQLNSFGVEYNEDEFYTHCMVSGIEKINIEKIPNIMSWIIKLDNYNNKVRKYDTALFKKVLFNRVFNNFLKLKYGKKVILTLLFKNKNLRSMLFNSFNISVSWNRLKYIMKNNFKDQEFNIE